MSFFIHIHGAVIQKHFFKRKVRSLIWRPVRPGKCWAITVHLVPNLRWSSRNFLISSGDHGWFEMDGFKQPIHRFRAWIFVRFGRNSATILVHCLPYFSYPWRNKSSSTEVHWPVFTFGSKTYTQRCLICWPLRWGKNLSQWNESKGRTSKLTFVSEPIVRCIPEWAHVSQRPLPPATAWTYLDDFAIGRSQSTGKRFLGAFWWEEIHEQSLPSQLRT